MELAVRYIELRYIGSYSGYIRACLARALKNAALTDSQINQLNRVFLALVEGHDYTDEFREYVKLWRRIATPSALQFLAALAKENQFKDRGAWLQQFAPRLVQAGVA